MSLGQVALINHLLKIINRVVHVKNVFMFMLEHLD